MKQLLLLFVLLSLFSCQDDTQQLRLKNKLHDNTYIAQYYKVAPDSVVTITGRKGTRIQFKTTDLQGILYGPDIKDSLVVELIELTNKTDLILANAQTVSDGQWLISGGAFKIDISVNGESLQLKEGKTMTATFPKTSAEDGMLLFYGDRDEQGTMNWAATEIILQDQLYYVLLYKESVTLNENLTRRFGGVETYESDFDIDSLGFMTANAIKKQFPSIDNFDKTIDTLTIYYLRDESETGSYRVFNKAADSLRLAFGEAIASEALYANLNIYQNVEISKLGWINIDKFAPDEPKASLTLKYSESMDAAETYLIDDRNNTILNVPEKVVEIPVNRSFTILSFALKGNDTYAYKKSVRLDADNTHTITYKKVSNAQLEAIMQFD